MKIPFFILLLSLISSLASAQWDFDRFLLQGKDEGSRLKPGFIPKKRDTPTQHKEGIGGDLNRHPDSVKKGQAELAPVIEPKAIATIPLRIGNGLSLGVGRQSQQQVQNRNFASSVLLIEGQYLIGEILVSKLSYASTFNGGSQASLNQYRGGRLFSENIDLDLMGAGDPYGGQGINVTWGGAMRRGQFAQFANIDLQTFSMFGLGALGRISIEIRDHLGLWTQAKYFATKPSSSQNNSPMDQNVIINEIELETRVNFNAFEEPHQRFYLGGRWSKYLGNARTVDDLSLPRQQSSLFIGIEAQFNSTR